MGSYYLMPFSFVINEITDNNSKIAVNNSLFVLFIHE